MSWFQSSKCLKCSKCIQLFQWFHTVIQSVIYGNEEFRQPIPVYTVNMKTYSHPTSPTKRSSRTENIHEYDIV